MGLVSSARIHVSLVAIAATLVMANMATAQPDYLRVTVYGVKPDMQDAFVASQKERTAELLKSGAGWRAGFHSHFGDREWILLQPMSKFAELDMPNPSQPALLRTLNNFRNYLLHLNQPLTFAAPEAKPVYATVTRVQVSRDRAPEYTAIVTEQLIPALKKGGVKSFYTYHTDFGGPMMTFWHVQPFATFTSLDGSQPLNRALGAEGTQKLRRALAAIDTSEEIYIWHYSPEISAGPLFGVSRQTSSQP